MADENLISKINDIKCALGIIAGVAVLSDEATKKALTTAVERIEKALKEMFEDG